MRALIGALALLAGTPAQAQTIVIVRHAERMTQGGGSDPALSSEGQARARALAAGLADEKLALVLTSPLARTRQTGEPAAKAAGIEVTPVAMDGGLAAHVARVVEVARKAPADSTVLVVGHSNTAPEIARALGDTSPQPIAECEFDRMTVLRLTADGVKASYARYGAPSSC